jgi:hypothetical protein
MAEIVYGNKMTLQQAKDLGVLGSAEALVPGDANKPWEALRPYDMPNVVETAKPEQQEPMPEKHDVSLYRALHHLKQGGLHRALGIPESETIPDAKLEAAKQSKNEHVRHMANFASVMSGFHHKS